jgi:hypothetical protein
MASDRETIGERIATDGESAATTAGGDRDRAISPGRPINRKNPIPKNAKIVAAAAIASPIKLTMTPIPRRSVVISVVEDRAVEGEISGAEVRLPERDWNVRSSICPPYPSFVAAVDDYLIMVAYLLANMNG